MNWILIGVFGAFGAILRYFFHTKLNVGGFPMGTLAVNVIGSFLAGSLLGGREVFMQWLSPSMTLAIGFGFLGALTTFSTFSVESIRYFEAGNFNMVAANVAGNVLLSLAFCYIGLKVGLMLTH